MDWAITDGPEVPHEQPFIPTDGLLIQPRAAYAIPQGAVNNRLPETNSASKRQLARSLECSIEPGETRLCTFNAVIDRIANHVPVRELHSQILV